MAVNPYPESFVVAGIVIESALPSFDKIYSYLVPSSMVGRNLAGCRVRVPFGRSDRKLVGLVLSVNQSDDCAKIKPILAVLDDEPVLDAEGISLLSYLRETTFCTWFDALRALIPAGLAYVPRGDGVRRRISDGLILSAAAVPGYAGTLTARQQEVYDFLIQAGSATFAEISSYIGASASVVRTLEQKGAAEISESPRNRDPYADNPDDEPFSAEALSNEQKVAFEQLSQEFKSEKPKPMLLYGVTGSGKTGVFLALADEIIRAGKSVLIMVPEISLTSQTVRRARAQFGGLVAVIHSGLSVGERLDAWKRAKSGEARVIVGTRSAVFAPLKNIGLIVIDEEQEHTYKSERSPRYHARDVAAARCRYHSAMLLTCSATPSVESYFRAKRTERVQCTQNNAQQNKYGLVTLSERFGNAQLPDVYIVDMTDREGLSNSQYLSDTLLGELRYNLEHGEQSILLHNRRGYSTVVKCTSCKEPAGCPHCSVAMVYHMASDSLHCHYCGYICQPPEKCSSCGSEILRYAGAGTQKIEQELNRLFPDARVARMDMDTTTAKFSHERLFSAFAAGEYDILVGTQMVAKGLNFPKVTLVGVLSADQALYSGDFRAYERAFALITQVVGRGGRGESPGRAFIQTYTPEHPIIALAARQDYPAFFEQEITSRKLQLYPPFCALAGVGFTGENEAEVSKAAHGYALEFRRLAAEKFPALPLVMLGPTPAEVPKVAGKYRSKLLLKCRNSRDTRAILAELLDWFYKSYKNVGIYVDMYFDRM